MNFMMYVWLAVFVITLVIELAVPALVSIWFTAGSFAAFIFSLFVGDNVIWLQIVIFIAVTFLTIYFLRPFVFKKSKKSKTNVDSMIGAIGCCINEIKKYELGTVKINGLVWNAYVNGDDEVINPNDLVEILEINGNKLLVKKHVKEDK